MVIVTRTEQIQFKSIKDEDYVASLCHASKNLFNVANYLVRQRFFENDKLYRATKHKSKHLWYKELYPMVKNTDEYKALPAQTAQQILKLLDKSWKAYFKAHAVWLKEWLKTKNPLRENEPKIPKYKHKNGEHIIVFTNQQSKIINGILKFPKIVNKEIKTRLTDIDLREIRIVPNGIRYTCEIVYDKEVSPEEIGTSRALGIDLGLRNIVTIANNFGVKPLVVKGNTANSINQFYNKEKARITSVYDKQKNAEGRKLKYGSKLRHLDWKKNNKVNDYFHKLSRMIVNYAHSNCVKTIVIGKNEGWKQNCNIGKKNNQKFCQLPLAKLINKIEYKCEELGIEVVLQEEAHTSKCSFLDNELIEHHDKYIGKRIKRGIFKTGKGILINADVNGALNIMKKAALKTITVDGVEDVGLHPLRCYV